MTPRDPWRRIEAVLRTEAEVIRRADFARLPALTAEKARLTATIEAGPPPDQGALDRIRASARRNAALIRAAQGGIAAARARIEAALAGGAPLRTYDRAGTAEKLDAPAPRLERRA